MHRTDFTNFHSFLLAHPWSVIFATRNASEELNPVISQHFESKYANTIAVARVDLSDAHEWFSQEIYSWLGRRHAPYQSAYYLIVAGKAVLRHSGIANDGTASAFELLFALASNSQGSNMWTTAKYNMNRRAAADVIGAFEGRLAKNPPTPSRAPDRESVLPAKDPFAVLEVPKNASQSEIAAAYKLRVLEYHPDRVAALGKDLRELAERRMAEINVAYAMLSKCG